VSKVVDEESSLTY